MGWFCWVCPEHRTEEDTIVPFTQLEKARPSCGVCNQPMERDKRREMFGGVTHRSKGIYPFVSEDILPNGMAVEVKDYAHESRLLRERGLQRHEVTSESRYRFKHRRDRA